MTLSAGAQAAAAPGTEALSVGGIFQVIFGLALVLGLLLGGAWLVKRFNPVPAGVAGNLKVVAGVAVGARERVVVVEIKDTWLVLGVAPGRVSSLHTLPREPGAPAAQPGFGNAAAANFAARLKQALERRA